ncbi:hypothetical protein [Streptomyces sp. DH8]|uniref:hypothetical protein n=1 Tax=Streptomyces sp. DH8 TaxID=2857008 RepID=UPI001E48F157|nr:hypothetical protein [Streptomyces sp. DH8]
MTGGLCFLALGGTFTWFATADASAAATDPKAAAAGGMASLVEDFIHPGAEQILQDRKIVLKRGDGNIMLKPGNGEGGINDCLSANNVFVESRVDKRGFCFITTGTTGYLAMEIPDAFFVWTQDQPIQATVTADGKTTVYKAPKNDVTEIGETDTPGGEKRSALVELRISK